MHYKTNTHPVHVLLKQNTNFSKQFLSLNTGISEKRFWKLETPVHILHFKLVHITLKPNCYPESVVKLDRANHFISQVQYDRIRICRVHTDLVEGEAVESAEEVPVKGSEVPKISFHCKHVSARQIYEVSIDYTDSKLTCVAV